MAPRGLHVIVDPVEWLYQLHPGGKALVNYEAAVNDEANAKRNVAENPWQQRILFIIDNLWRQHDLSFWFSCSEEEARPFLDFCYLHLPHLKEKIYKLEFDRLTSLVTPKDGLRMRLPQELGSTVLVTSTNGRERRDSSGVALVVYMFSATAEWSVEDAPSILRYLAAAFYQYTGGADECAGGEGLKKFFQCYAPYHSPYRTTSLNKPAAAIKRPIRQTLMHSGLERQPFYDPRSRPGPFIAGGGRGRGTGRPHNPYGGRGGAFFHRGGGRGGGRGGSAARQDTIFQDRLGAPAPPPPPPHLGEANVGGPIRSGSQQTHYNNGPHDEDLSYNRNTSPRSRYRRDENISTQKLDDDNMSDVFERDSLF